MGPRLLPRHRGAVRSTSSSTIGRRRASMAIAKAERLMNLALCLLGTRRALSKRELRESIEAYLEAGSDDSFHRMVERDKDARRELALVIETAETPAGETGYLARRDSNRLPPVQLDA